MAVMKSRTLIAFVKSEDEVNALKNDDYSDFYKLSNEKQREVKIGLQVRNMELFGAKEIKIPN